MTKGLPGSLTNGNAPWLQHQKKKTDLIKTADQTVWRYEFARPGKEKIFPFRIFTRQQGFRVHHFMTMNQEELSQDHGNYCF